MEQLRDELTVSLAALHLYKRHEKASISPTPFYECWFSVWK